MNFQKILEQAKEENSVLTISYSEFAGENYYSQKSKLQVQKGKVFDFNEEFLQLKTFKNLILIRINSIIRIKISQEENV